MIVKSSAKERTRMSRAGGSGGRSHMRRLKRVGDGTATSGTPMGGCKFLRWCYHTECMLGSQRESLNHRLLLFCSVVLSILFLSMWQGTTSNALFMSMAISMVQDGDLQRLHISTVVCVV